MQGVAYLYWVQILKLQGVCLPLGVENFVPDNMVERNVVDNLQNAG